MVIGEIGNLFSITHKIEYFSTSTFLEFDSLIVNFNELLKQVSNPGSDTRAIFLKRKHDLEEFILHKKIPIIYLLHNLDNFIFIFQEK